MPKDVIRKVRIAKELPYHRVGDEITIRIEDGMMHDIKITHSGGGALGIWCTMSGFRALIKMGTIEEIDLTLNPSYCSWYYKPDVFEYRLGCRDTYVKEEYVKDMKYCPYCAKKINWVNNLSDETIEEIK